MDSSVSAEHKQPFTDGQLDVPKTFLLYQPGEMKGLLIPSGDKHPSSHGLTL